MKYHIEISGLVPLDCLLGCWLPYSLPHQSICFSVKLEKAFYHVSLGILWDALREYGVSGQLL